MKSIRQTTTLCILLFFPVADGFSQEFESRISSYGLALPSESVEIRPNVDSHVSRIRVVEGQTVRQGDLLIELSCDAAIAKKKIAQLAAAESGSKMNAQAELKYAEENFRKLEALYKRKAVNDKEFNEAQLRLERAQATLQMEVEQHLSNQARFDLADAELQEYFLKAPFDGQVTHVNVSPGDAVSSNTDVLRLIAANSLRVELYVPIKESAKYAVGKSVKLQLHEPFENTTLDAEIVFRSPVIEATTGTLRILLEIDNRDSQLPAGFTVSILK